MLEIFFFSFSILNWNWVQVKTIDVYWNSSCLFFGKSGFAKSVVNGTSEWFTRKWDCVKSGPIVWSRHENVF